MSNQKDWVDLHDAVQILESNIKLFHEGDTSAYKSIAVQLYVLLCDTYHPLLSRVSRQVKFHPMFTYQGNEPADGIVFQLPAMVSPPGGIGSETARLFDESKTPIDLQEWLGQPFISSEITIRKLIGSVRNKEAAHSDPKYGEKLALLKSIPLVDKPAHIKGIVVIGEYIFKQIKTALEGNIVESTES